MRTGVCSKVSTWQYTTQFRMLQRDSKRDEEIFIPLDWTLENKVHPAMHSGSGNLGLGWGALAGPPHSQVPGCSFDLSSFFFKRERESVKHTTTTRHTHTTESMSYSSIIWELRKRERENPPPSQLLLLMEGPPWNKHRCRVISKPAFLPSFLPTTHHSSVLYV